MSLPLKHIGPKGTKEFDRKLITGFNLILSHLCFSFIYVHFIKNELFTKRYKGGVGKKSDAWLMLNSLYNV